MYVCVSLWWTDCQSHWDRERRLSPWECMCECMCACHCGELTVSLIVHKCWHLGLVAGRCWKSLCVFRRRRLRHRWSQKDDSMAALTRLTPSYTLKVSQSHTSLPLSVMSLTVYCTPVISAPVMTQMTNLVYHAIRKAATLNSQRIDQISSLFSLCFCFLTISLCHLWWMLQLCDLLFKNAS